MKLFLFLILKVAFGFPVYATEVISVTTVDGKSVEVKESDLRHALEVFTEKRGIFGDIEYAVGTVFVRNPKVEVSGKKTYINWFYTSPDGLCKLFGLGKSISRTQAEKSKGDPVTFINEDAKLGTIGNADWPIIHQISCYPKR